MAGEMVQWQRIAPRLALSQHLISVTCRDGSGDVCGGEAAALINVWQRLSRGGSNGHLSAPRAALISSV